MAAMDDEPEVKDPQLPWGGMLAILLIIVAGIYFQKHPDSPVALFFRRRY